MAVYAVMSAAPSELLKSKIAELFPGDDHYEVAPEQWLVSTDKVGSTISTDLGIANNGASVNAVIFRITGEGWGWHKKTLWEWLSVKGAK